MSNTSKAVKRLWVFDLDGPLMKTGELYEKALTGMARVILEIFGEAVSRQEIMTVQNQIDQAMLREINPENGKPYLFHKSRFPLSLVRTYKFFCRKIGKKLIKSTAHRLNKIGARVFDECEYETIVRPEVLPLFKFLKGKGDIVIVLTKGAYDVQFGKKKALQNFGIMDYCDDFIVVPDTKDEMLKKIKETNKAIRYYCAGDTYFEDVLLGMNVGYFGIHIPYELNWKERGKSEEIEACRDKKRSIAFSDISQISRYFKTLEKFAKLKGA